MYLSQLYNKPSIKITEIPRGLLQKIFICQEEKVLYVEEISICPKKKGENHHMSSTTLATNRTNQPKKYIFSLLKRENLWPKLRCLLVK